MTKEKQLMKEQKELQKLRALQAKPDYKGYFFMMIALVLLFQFLDMMATTIWNNLQEVIVRDFAGLSHDASIVEGSAGYQPYQDTLSKITIIQIFSYVFLGIVPFYKTLADKIGRRFLFIFNAGFLGVAMFLGGLTDNLYIFLVASTVITFFTIHDMQILYVAECVPEDKRGTWIGIVTAVGNAAAFVVIFLRLTAMNPDGTSGPIEWRGIYILVGVIGIITFVLAAIFLRESRPFINSRIKYLEKTPEQREAEKNNAAKSQGGIVPGFKLVFKNKQLLWLAVAMFLINAANNMVSAYNTSILSQNNFSTFEITIALTASCATGIIIGYVMGPIADKISRKSAAIIFGVLSAVSFIAFAFGTSYFGNGTVGAIIAGTLFGISMNSYNNILTITTLMLTESSPASMRSSIIGVSAFFRVSAVIAMAASSALFKVLPIGTVCTILSAPFHIGACVVIALLTKETKGRTFDEIEAEFSDDALVPREN